MGHLTISLTGMLLALSFSVLVTWAPIFAFAYWRRQFGGSARGYFKAYLLTSAGTVAFFILLGLAEELARG